MKKTLFVSILVFTSFFLNTNVLVAAPAPPGAGVQVGFFYSSLSPYGEWIEVEAGYHVWRPLRVQAGWRPYLEGRWVWTDFGWYWVSYEPFGWAVFHYGRWYYDDYYGWVWVPDDQWGPAWVEWRYNDSYIGWAPLPPYASFSITVGIRFTHRWNAPYHYWNFIPYRNFGAVVRYRDVVTTDGVRRLIHTTRSAGRYESERDRIINRGVDRTYIERRTNTRIAKLDVRESTDRRGEQVVRDGGVERVEIYRPSRSEFEQRPERIESRRGERTLSLDLKSIDQRRNRIQDGTDRNAGREGAIEQREIRRQDQPTTPSPADQRVDQRRKSDATPRVKPETRNREKSPSIENRGRTTPREIRQAPKVSPQRKTESSPRRQPTGNQRRDR